MGASNIALHLTEKEHSFIQNISKQCRMDSIYDKPEDAILCTMIRLLQHLELDVSGIKTEDQLLDRLQGAIRIKQAIPN